MSYSMYGDMFQIVSHENINIDAMLESINLSVVNEGKILDFLKDAWDKIKKVIKSIIDKIGEILDKADDGIRNILNNIRSKIKSNNVALPTNVKYYELSPFRLDKVYDSYPMDIKQRFDKIKTLVSRHRYQDKEELFQDMQTMVGKYNEEINTAIVIANNMKKTINEEDNGSEYFLDKTEFEGSYGASKDKVNHFISNIETSIKEMRDASKVSKEKLEIIRKDAEFTSNAFLTIVDNVTDVDKDNFQYKKYISVFSDASSITIKYMTTVLYCFKKYIEEMELGVATNVKLIARISNGLAGKKFDA